MALPQFSCYFSLIVTKLSLSTLAYMNNNSSCCSGWTTWRDWWWPTCGLWVEYSWAKIPWSAGESPTVDPLHLLRPCKLQIVQMNWPIRVSRVLSCTFQKGVQVLMDGGMGATWFHCVAYSIDLIWIFGTQSLLCIVSNESHSRGFNFWEATIKIDFWMLESDSLKPWLPNFVIFLSVMFLFQL